MNNAARNFRRPGSISWICVVVLFAAITLVYSQSFTAPFFFDDIESIVENQTIRQLWPPALLLQPPPMTSVSGRPLVNLSFALDYALFGLDVRGYHVINLLLHLLSTLLLLGVVRRTLVLPSLAAHGFPATLLAWVTALLWALHPLQSESVIYIIQRTELLMALCYLLTLYAFIRAATEEGPAWRWRMIAVVSCLCGMAVKEVMVTCPLLVALYDRLFLARSWGEVVRARGRLLAALASSWVLLVSLQLSNPRGESAGFAVIGADFWSNLRTQCQVIIHYLRLSVWPTGLVIDYHDWPLARTWSEVLPQAIVLAVVAGYTVWSIWRARPAAFLGAWFLGILAPTSLVPIVTEMAAERRMYLPLAAVIVGILLLAQWAFIRATGRMTGERSRSAVPCSSIPNTWRHAKILNALRQELDQRAP